jgi:hypothetical protein
VVLACVAGRASIEANAAEEWAPEAAERARKIAGDPPISRADPDDVREVESILMERRRAAGWLRGEDELLSEVPLDT